METNNMGSEVVDGYRCKPVERDPSRPMMEYQTHLFVCQAERCKQSQGAEGLAERLRQLIQSIGLHQGASRIKITQTLCFGACRFRAVSSIYARPASRLNQALWLRHVHRYNDKEWIEIFRALAEDRDLRELMPEESFIEFSLYD